MDHSSKYRDLAIQTPEAKAFRRDEAQELLADAKLSKFCDFKPGGSHIVVRVKDTTMDIWPGSGKWVVRPRAPGATRMVAEGTGIRTAIDYLVKVNKC